MPTYPPPIELGAIIQGVEQISEGLREQRVTLKPSGCGSGKRNAGWTENRDTISAFLISTQVILRLKFCNHWWPTRKLTALKLLSDCNWTEMASR